MRRTYMMAVGDVVGWCTVLCCVFDACFTRIVFLTSYELCVKKRVFFMVTKLKTKHKSKKTLTEHATKSSTPTTSQTNNVSATHHKTRILITLP